MELIDATVHSEIFSARDAYLVLREIMTADVEEFWALALNSKKQMLAAKMLFRGTVDTCMVHPRDVFRFACMLNASSMIVAHNHPSADLEPSPDDLKLTERLIRVGNWIEIPILDHLILSQSGYKSLAGESWWERMLRRY